MYRLHFYILMLAFLPVRGYAVMDSSTRVQYNLENGLPSSNVYSTMQDRNGYIWLCTDNGIVKYNGYTFKTFTTNDGLPSSDIWKLFEDDLGRIWFHCYTNEIGYIKNDVYHSLNVKLPQVTRITTIGQHKGKVKVTADFKHTSLVYLIDSDDKVRNFIFSEATWPFRENATNSRAYIVYIGNYLYEVCSDGYKILYKKLVKRFDFYSHLIEGILFYYLRDGLFINFLQGWNGIHRYDANRNVSDTIKLAYYGGTGDEKLHTMEFPDSTVMLYSDRAIYHLNGYLGLIKRTSLQYIGDKKFPVCDYATDKFSNTWVSTNSVGCFMNPRYNFPLFRDTVLNQLTGPKYLRTLKNGYNCWWSSTDGKLLVTTQNGVPVFANVYSDKLQGLVDIDTDKLWLFFRDRQLEYNLLTKQHQPFF